MRNFKKIKIVLIASLGLLLGALTVFSFTVGTTTATTISKKETVVATLPVRLTIPSIKTSAVVEYVGLTATGAVDVPTGPNNVAWFNLGARPGDVGTAIIDGHSGYKNNKPAVFDNLYKLRIGDKIYTKDIQGVTTTFVVKKIQKYDPKTNMPGVFGVNDQKAHLNLITCTGTWDAVAKSHSSRLIIFTDKVL